MNISEYKKALAVAVIGAGVIAGGLYLGQFWNQGKTNERPQILPIEVRNYDMNNDGYLDGRELEHLVKDFELKAKVEMRKSPESR